MRAAHWKGSHLGYVSELPQPAVDVAVLRITSADMIPNAGEPVSDKHVEAQEEDEHRGSILEIAVELPDHSTQSQETDHFKGTEKTSNSLLQ